MDLTKAQKIVQALLYFGETTKKSELAKFLGLEVKDIDNEVDEINNILGVLGLSVIDNGPSMEISLAQEISSLISKQKIEELKTELSESALQTLSVILYKSQATKAEIDFVRGVDSSRSIKSLLTRGIIDREDAKNKKVYFPSTETLRYLGLTNIKQVPDFEEISGKLETLIRGE